MAMSAILNFLTNLNKSAEILHMKFYRKIPSHYPKTTKWSK